VTMITNIGFICMITYCYSECINMYTAKYKGMIFTAILTFLLLVLMLSGSAKYAETKKQSMQIMFSGIIGSIFYIVIRFFPELEQQFAGGYQYIYGLKMK